MREKNLDTGPEDRATIEKGQRMSKKLYIIGNGFDLANKLPTSYNCFRQYLLDKININEEEKDALMINYDLLFPNNSRNAELIVNMIDAALFREYRHKKDWNCFEDVLGKLRYDDLWNDEPKNELNGVVVHRAFTKLRDYFNEWICSINLGVAKRIENYNYDENDLFLSFNYTLTLEKIYKVPHGNICHVHGLYGDSELEFGHKEYEDNSFRRENGAERQIAIVREMLVKDTQMCYQKNQGFFDRITKDVNIIISIGFSYADVDLYYIEKIIENISDDTIWYLYCYKFFDTLRYARIIQKCGFRGKIRFFRSFKKRRTFYNYAVGCWEKIGRVFGPVSRFSTK